VFERKADRYEHRIIYSKPDGSNGTLASREGRPDESWPPSPALQSLNLETRPDGKQTIMLVGMAGRSHWSMSVEADLAQNRLAFDIACRMHEPPVWLGSSYTSTNKQSLVEPLDFLSLEAWNGERPCEKMTIQIDGSSGSLQIPAPAATDKFPQTLRWCYKMEIEP
jgi:hypothetical protein